MKKFIKENGINIVVFLMFAILTFIIGMHHEPWADEAHAWLIGRDCTIKEIILTVCKYNGHPALWYIILRLFINVFHFPYENFYVIPWIFSCLGVYIFLFKSKMPIVIKILFPFTFFIFYQYTITARNYALVFPMLAIIAVNYKNRLEKPYIYALLLFLLANIHAYSFVTAFVLLCFFTADTIRIKRLKNIIPLRLTFLGLFLTALYVNKPADCVTSAVIKIPPPNVEQVIPFLFNVSKGYFLNYSGIFLPFLTIIITIALYVYACKVFCKTKYQTLFFCLINLSIIVILKLLYCHFWHRGYLLLTLLFSCWILMEENNFQSISFKKNKIFFMTIIFIFLLQIQNSIENAVYDIRDSYCGSKAAALFIKENNLDKEKILGYGFHPTALQPYFKHNIYDNLNKSYWDFKRSTEDENKNKFNKNTQIIVAQLSESLKNINLEFEYKNYKKFVFKGKMKGGSSSASTSFVIYIKKDNFKQN